jgi:hypothetical protein
VYICSLLFASCIATSADPQCFDHHQVKKKKKHGFSGNVLGTLHVCPICVRKLQSACGFELRDRYVALAKVYAELGFAAQQEWCAEVVKRGDAVV